jgi:hypothetical protein|tara:strand:- start:5485 stop:5730 length:246 start_codon:yes stop_codon:yes gene_type:complete
MAKHLVGHHLLRVRIRKRIFDALKEAAYEEAERTGEHVTVSDLVRAACYNYLVMREAVQNLENLPPPDLDGEILVVTTPLL